MQFIEYAPVTFPLYFSWCFVLQNDCEVTRSAVVWDDLKVTIKETHNMRRVKVKDRQSQSKLKKLRETDIHQGSVWTEKWIELSAFPNSKIPHQKTHTRSYTTGVLIYECAVMCFGCGSRQWRLNHRPRWCHICLAWYCVDPCVCVRVCFSLWVIKNDWPQHYSKSLPFSCCCSVFHHKDETWCHMCNYWQWTHAGGLIYGDLPRITSAAITEGTRWDGVIFNNGNHDVLK